MRRPIQLSGLGINCKSTIVRDLGDLGKIAPLLSDSRVVSTLHNQGIATFHPYDRLSLRYYSILLSLEIMEMLPKDTLLIDRGLVDALCFAKLTQRGILPTFDWEVSPDAEEFDYSIYEEYEKGFDFSRVFIKTLNKPLVESVLLNEKIDNIDKRSIYYKTYDQYLELQELFYKEYCKICPDHILVFLKEDLNKSLEEVKEIILTLV